MPKNQQDKIRKEVTGFYDTVSHKFSQTRKNWWRELDFIDKYIQPGSKLLDFGCGNGRLLELIYGNNLKTNYTGADVSESLIDLARAHYAKEKFVLIESEEKLPFPDNSFDVAVSVAVFHHLTPKMAESALKEISRVLKPGGVLVITSWRLWDWKRVKYLLKSFPRKLIQGGFSKTGRIPFSYHEGGEMKTHWRFCHWWTKRELENLCRKNGFEILESGYSFDKRNKKRNIYVAGKKG
ncbi:MAG: class I SAM-dependent methyltransferase [Candidatus Moranbacteria bacterium]|nr:class I SAM-dependent methyltransferase [Candidatus Moranbacteria bacterium]